MWSFGYEDLQRFKSGEAAQPAWFDQKAANIVTTQFHVRPALLRLLAKDPVTQLLEFMVEPDVEAWSRFGKYLPLLFVRNDNRARSNATTAGAQAILALDGATPFSSPGSDVCWTFTDGGLALAAGVQTMADPPQAVLAVDDRDHLISNLDGKAWKEWLRLSNWLGLSDRHRISTYSLLSTTPAGAEVPADETALPAEWQAVLDDAVSDAERDLIRALASTGVAVPALGFETDGGEVIDLAWAEARVGVTFNGDAAADGWTFCSADVAQIVAALKTNGVM